MDKVNKILIVGGGTAGWLTAAYLARALKPTPVSGMQITLVESKELGIIGVGEGTFPSIKTTLATIGIDEARFIRDCNATFKQGIRFADWLHPNDGRQKRHSYFHPFSLPSQRPDGPELLPYWLNGVAKKSVGFDIPFAQSATLQHAIAAASQGPKRFNDGDFAGPMNYAYHFDAGKFATLLCEHARSLGVHQIFANIDQVVLTGDGAVQSVVTKEVGLLEADLYIDCSGFRAKLIGDALGSPFKNCNDVLFVDRALAIQVPYPDEASDGPIPSFTISTAHEAGWTWDIGLQQRRGVGYVFSSRHTSEDQALQVLHNYLKSTNGDSLPDVHPRLLKLNVGYRETQWIQNCVAIGLSGGFLEPLESSGIGLIESAAYYLTHLFPHDGNFAPVAKQFNELMKARYERIVDFIKLHYCLSKRVDSTFWTDNTDPATIPVTLQDKLAMWKKRTPHRLDFVADMEMYPLSSWQYVLYGLDYATDLSNNHGSYPRGAEAAREFQLIQKLAQHALTDLPDHRTLINHILGAEKNPGMRHHLIAVLVVLCGGYAHATDHAWDDLQLSADQRAGLVLAQMNQDEKLQLVSGYFGADLPSKNWTKPSRAINDSAGFVPGIARLGIPSLFETDAGLGVATQASGKRHPRERTALPSGLATAASWNKDLAYAVGAMIGAEGRSSGFNVMLAGGVNLVRDPRNGRNFEYAGEDPLLAGIMVARQIRGIESNHLIATMKHFALNAQETGRFVLDARIDASALRMSDLLAMQLVVEQSNPGAVMCAYNRVNGSYACENNFLLNTVLKSDWAYQGFVMSDWGAVHSTVNAALHGLDQESGAIFDDQIYFGTPLKSALEHGAVPQQRLDDMVRRILRSMFVKGVVDNPVQENGPINFAAHALVSRSAAEEGMVLLKNRDHLLPLQPGLKNILIIGGHADVGVLSGGGSSQVYPQGGIAVHGLDPADWPGPVVYFPSSPLQAIRKLAPQTQVDYDDGREISVAVRRAAKSGIAIIFADQWVGEANDAVSLDLPDPQNELIRAVSIANPNTIVVLETGGPVTMPWIDQVGAVLEAWYPGTSGGEAIARILSGVVNPSAHLPVTFPESELQLVRSHEDGDVRHQDRPFIVNYREGAAVGYKWYDRQQLHPLFPFGFGLSYTDFKFSGLTVECHQVRCQAKFVVTNTGMVSGKAVPQIYVGSSMGDWEAPRRLAGWEKIELVSGQQKQVVIDIDPRLLAMYDVQKKRWHISANRYQFELARYDKNNDKDDATERAESSIEINLPDTDLNMQGQALNSH